MKTNRQDLYGIDFAKTLRQGAADMMRDAIANTERREQEAQKFQYTKVHELVVLVFEERREPPLWRMETLQPVYDHGIVKVWDSSPQFLKSEMRVKLGNLFLMSGVHPTHAECRAEACKLDIREMGTVRLKDSQRFEGEPRS